MLLNNIEDNGYDNVMGINIFNRMYNTVVKYFTGFSFINLKYRHEVISFDIPYTVLLNILGYEATIGFPESNLYRWSSITTEIMNHTMHRIVCTSNITCLYCYALETIYFKFNIERFNSCNQDIINEVKILRNNIAYQEWF